MRVFFDCEVHRPVEISALQCALRTADFLFDLDCGELPERRLPARRDRCRRRRGLWRLTPFAAGPVAVAARSRSRGRCRTRHPPLAPPLSGGTIGELATNAAYGRRLNQPDPGRVPSDVLQALDELSLSKLVRNYQAGTLEGSIPEGRSTIVGSYSPPTSERGSCPAKSDAGSIAITKEASRD